MDLRVFSQNPDSVQSGLGARITAPLPSRQLPMVPQLCATWQHEFSNNSRGLDARLSQSSPVFIFRTDSPQRDFAVVWADLTIAAREDHKMRLDCNVEAGRDRHTAHYLSLDMKWELWKTDRF